MSNKMLILAGALVAVLSVGAGCVASQTNTNSSNATATNTAPTNSVKAPIVEEKTAWVGPTACTKEAAVAFRNTNDSNAAWEITLGGKVVKTLTFEGGRSMELFKEIKGMTFLANNPDGMGGYIPYGWVEQLYSVDRCTGEVVEIVAPNLMVNPGFQDVSNNGVLVAFLSSDNDKKVEVGIQNIGNAKSPYVSPSKWTVPGDWNFGGDVKFNVDATKLAFVVGNGPDNENSAVYTLDLTTGQFTQIAVNAQSLLAVDGWSGDQVSYR